MISIKRAWTWDQALQIKEKKLVKDVRFGL